MKSFFFFLFTCVMGIALNAQVPIRFYGFDNIVSGTDNIQITESFNLKTGIGKNITSSTNRFNEADKAAYFHSTNSKIIIPVPFDKLSAKSEYTITFWIKRKTANTTFVLDPTALNNTKSIILYAKDNNNNMLFGLSYRYDRLIIDRYIPSTKKLFELWEWDEINFSEKDAWYFVGLSYYKNKCHIVVGKPFATDLVCRTNYFASQDLQRVSEWGFGYTEIANQVDGFANNVGLDYLDDLKIYDGYKSVSALEGIYDIERINFPHSYRNLTSSVIEEPLDDNSIRLYPNPSTGSVQIEMNLSQPETITTQLLKFSGEVVFNQTETYSSGKKTIQKDFGSLLPGIYSLVLCTATWSKSITLQIN